MDASRHHPVPAPPVAGNPPTTQTSAEKLAAQAAIAFSDLSTSTAREGEAYNALTVIRCRAIRANAMTDAQIRAAIQAQHGRIMDANDEAARAWNGKRLHSLLALNCLTDLI